MYKYEGIRFNPESGIVEGYNGQVWLRNLQDTLLLLDRSFPHTRQFVLNRRTGESGENTRFVPRPDELFFRGGFNEQFYNAFEKDQKRSREARKELHANKLTPLMPAFYVFSNIAATDGLTPVFVNETLSEDEPRITMVHMEPTKMTVYHDSAGDDPGSTQRIKRYMQVLMPDFSAAENFFPCTLEFGKEWVDEGGVVQRQQKKIHFPQSLPGGDSAPDMLHHLQSIDFRNLREVLAVLHQFSAEQMEVNEERWQEIASRAIVLQGHDRNNPNYRLPGVIMDALSAGKRTRG